MAIDTEERTSEIPASRSSTPGQPVKSNKKVIMIVLIVVGALVVLGLIGSIVSGLLIKKGAESLLSAATGGTVEIGTKNDGEIKIKTDNGEITSGSSQKLPADFPKEVPLYGGSSKLTSVSTYNTEGEGRSFSVMYDYKDSGKKAFAFYEKALAENGWVTEVSTSSPGGGYSVIAKNEAAQRNVSISISDIEGDGSVAAIVVAPSKK